MPKNTITKEGLIQFIEKNFDTLRVGGCADFYSTDYNGMSMADIYACESAIFRLLFYRHPKTGAVKDMLERMEQIKNEEE